MEQNHVSSSEKNKVLWLVILSLIGLGINVAGAQLALLLGLPLYLDNIGSALAAALGGYIPGIVVGFLTNIINGIGEYSTTYYGSLTVLIAVFSAFYASKGYYGKVRKLPLIIVTFALIGGALGSVLTDMLYGSGSLDAGITAPLANRLFSTGAFTPFWAKFCADVLIDLLDKTVTVVLVVLVLRLLPAAVKDRFYFTGWRQAPLSIRTLTQANRKYHRKSLRAKIILLVAVAMIITGGVVTAISYINYRRASIDEQESLARGVVDVIRGAIDPDRVDEYIEKGEEADGYTETEAILKSLMDSSDYIEYCYAYRILEDGCHVVFDPDTEDVPGEEPGTVLPFDTAFEKYREALLAGKPIDPVDSNETYGWLLTFYEPVYDRYGQCQCYAAVDINMSHIAEGGYRFLARVLSLFFGFFVIILTLVIWLAEYNVIIPINSMALLANTSDYSTEESREKSVRGIESLKIHTGDEIENLYTAMVNSSRDMSRTATDMARFIAEMQKQSEVIGKLQNGLILVLADMVESRDQNTGEHVRKTAAYTGVIMRQLLKEHVYEDQLTEEFIQDVIHSAPLHDVGKIQVPDAILNKPGKLTDEEFARMKTHTTAGAEIITSAMSMVSEGDSGYLKEARNLAHFHHEKWNGTGYPLGLKGEEIPLSARIMAVADVFDALVSKRSYKDGFPFEKAMAIIEEGSGSHFDPQVAGAFLRARDEVRSIMESHMGR